MNLSTVHQMQECLILATHFGLLNELGCLPSLPLSVFAPASLSVSGLCWWDERRERALAHRIIMLMAYTYKVNQIGLHSDACQ